MTKKILIQLDGDAQPSSFDSVVAIDAGVDHLLRYGGVATETLTPIVHGAMFTRGGEALKHTAIFVGGSDVSVAESIFAAVRKTFFGPVRVSVMLDANGCNTTAAAAVVSAARHAELRGANALVLGGTGPVGRRVARLLAGEGAIVRLSSRSLDRARSACDEIIGDTSADFQLHPTAVFDETSTRESLAGCQIVVACGAAGVELASAEMIASLDSLRVAIDLNAVPPSGLGGIGAMDKAKPIENSRSGAVGYGAIGVGGLKMKTHRAAIESLFESNDKRLDADEIYAIAKAIG